MASPYHSHLLSTSTARLSNSSKITLLKTHSSSQWSFRGYPCYGSMFAQNPRSRPDVAFQGTRPKIMRPINVSTAGPSDDHKKLNWVHIVDKGRDYWDHAMDKGREYWDKCPQPVKNFPWNRAMENFIQHILDVVLSVIRFLYVPLLAVSSLSEVSYCAHERKLFLTPFPLLIGIVLARVLRETALELSPLLKDAEVPWHLIVIAIFFILLKLPGPYYPYWGRILIPHFANGGLVMSLWDAFWWYRRPLKPSSTAEIQNPRNSPKETS